MAITRGLGTTGNAAGTVTPLDHKLAQSGLLAKQGAGSNLIRPGLFFDGVVNIVTGTSGMSYNVAPFTAALSRGAAAGTVLLCNDGTVNVVTTAAPGSNSRIDIVYAWQREFSLDGVDSNPVIGVVQGSPAAVPVAPSLSAFPGAIELARITVPAGVTATNSGPTITQTAPFTAAAGGVLVFRTSAERNAAVVADGTLGYVVASGLLQMWRADVAAWVNVDGVFARGRQTFSGVTAGSGGLADLGSLVNFPSLPYATVVDLEVAAVVDLTAAPPSGRTVILQFETTAGTLAQDISATIDWASSTPAAGSQRAIAQRASVDLPALTAADIKLRWNPSNNAVRVFGSAWRYTRRRA